MGTGIVFDIQKFSVNDGPGIRTTVFLKGCSLNCLWCHNPESKSFNRELLYTAEKCRNCGLCVSKCPRSCHRIQESRHVLERTNCTACGSCIDRACPALELAGKEWDADGVIAEVLKDRLFYEHSGGGMTLSGGEPLCQAEFSLELLQLAKAEKLHTCLETSAYSRPEVIAAFVPWVDLFLFDYKETDPELHREYTGGHNKIILSHLSLLDRAGGKIVLRCPIIPSKNDREDHFKGIAETANNLKNIQEIQIEPYHPFGEGKCRRLGTIYPLPGIPIPDEKTVSLWVQAIQRETRVPVLRA